MSEAKAEGLVYQLYTPVVSTMAMPVAPWSVVSWVSVQALRAVEACPLP